MWWGHRRTQGPLAWAAERAQTLKLRAVSSVSLLLGVSLVLAIPGPALAQSAPQATSSLPAQWNDAVATLAEKIANLAGRARTISLEVQNMSSLSQLDVIPIRHALEADLTQRGFHLDQDSSGREQVVVTLSEGVEGYIWVAEVRGESNEQTAMVQVSSSSELNKSPARATMSLQRKFVWSQPEQFLDFGQHITNKDQSIVFVLEPTRLVEHRLEAGIVTATEEATVSNFEAPRDPRGQVMSALKSQIAVYTQGTNCVGGSSPTLHLECDANAPLVPGEESFIARRNYFAGPVAVWLGPLAVIPNFYSVAYPVTFRALVPDSLTAVAADRETRLQAELDQKVRLYEKSVPPDRIPRLGGDLVIEHSAHPSAVFSGWGDDVVTVATGCGNTWDVLVTGAEDWTQPDHIQIYEIKDRQASKVGQPLDFPGPILALWSSTDLKSARVVSRNLQTGMYEASNVSVSCSE